MAHLWVSSVETWAALLLPGDALVLTPVEPSFARPLVPGEALAGRVVLRRASGEDGTAEKWLLLAPPQAGVRINSQPLVTGLRVLNDRDEILLRRAQPVFFSTERLAQVESYPGEARATFCPRCRQALIAGSLAVQCPGCRLWHHESDQQRCWTYSETCTMCAQPTALGTGFRWSPEATEL